MAGFDPYHVPQQSRRDKLRALLHNDHQGLVPFYDPSDLLTYTNLHHHHSTSKQSSDAREEGVNLIMSTTTTAASTSHYAGGMSPISSTFQEIGNNNPFLYTPQNPRFLDQSLSFHGGGEAMVYKPEPLSVAEAHNNNNNSTLNNSNSQGLSLSLSSHYHSNQTISLPLELNLQQYSFGSTCNNDMSKSCVPLGPFKGYASILKGSRFLTPAQQLLEELCDVGREFFAEKLEADSGLMDPPPDGNVVIDESQEALSDGGEHGRKKSRLISMLDELYRKYKQYYHQLQTVVVSFETVAGLGNAAPFANLALKSMFKHFRCLKDAITDQLQCASKTHGQINCERDSIPRVGNPGKGPYCERQATHNVDHPQPVWRPQRGLPERAVSVLRAWLFDHFLHPYPTDTDKVMLAKQTGLSRNQVSNWFINARVRLWKPMVEEIHMLDTRQGHKVSQRDQGQNMSNSNIEHFPTSNPLVCETDPSTSAPRRQDQPSKRTRNDHLTHIPIGSEDMMNLSYDNLSSHNSRVSTGGVSLTLGLHHQNNGIGLSEPFRINAARRFGIDANNEGFIVGGLEAQNGQYGRGDIIGEQFLHEFVG